MECAGPCGSYWCFVGLEGDVTSDMAARKVRAISALSSSWHAQSPAIEV